MKSFQYVLLFATLLSLCSARRGREIPGEYIVEVKGDCEKGCRRELRRSLRASGLVRCDIKDEVAKIKRKSWVFVSCQNLPERRQRIRAAVATAVSVKIVRVDPNVEVTADIFGLRNLFGSRRCRTKECRRERRRQRRERREQRREERRERENRRNNPIPPPQEDTDQTPGDNNPPPVPEEGNGSPEEGTPPENEEGNGSPEEGSPPENEEGNGSPEEGTPPENEEGNGSPEEGSPPENEEGNGSPEEGTPPEENIPPTIPEEGTGSPPEMVPPPQEEIEEPKLLDSLWGVDELDGSKDGRRCPLGSKLGAGVDVYILDTGCTPVRGGLCTNLINTRGTCADDNGHGKHVAGTATGDKYGVAPKAVRSCVKVLDRLGSGTYFDIINAISSVVTHHQQSGRPGVINMSLGGPTDDSMNDAVHEASGDGLYFAVAAGNEAEDACGSSPASATTDDPFVYSVAAHDKDGNAALFTNFGACADISAPGVDIQSDGGFLSGTSMASPHVAGAMAVLLSDGKTVGMSTMTGAKTVPNLNKPVLEISC